jgi:hypothetical protein
VVKDREETGEVRELVACTHAGTVWALRLVTVPTNMPPLSGARGFRERRASERVRVTDG